MQFNQPLIPEQSLDDAIDRQPLIVAPDALLSEVIALMSQKRGRLDVPLDSAGLVEAPSKSSSFALVMQENNLLGIITERDIVKLVAENGVTQDLRISSVMTTNPITLPRIAFRDVFGPLFLFRRHGVRHLPVVDENGLVGVISADSIRSLLRPIDLLKLKRVSEVMTTPVITAPLTCVVSDAAKLMSIYKVSCIVITQETEIDDEVQTKPVGIITERDIVQFLALQLNLTKIHAHQAMSTPLFLLQPEDSLWKAYQEMESRRVRRLVVTWNWGKGIGIVTQTNLLRSLDFSDITNIEEIIELTVQSGQQQIQQVIKQKIDEQKELERLLSLMLNNLYSIVTQNYTSPDALQSQIKSTLFSIEQIQNLLRYFNQQSQDVLQRITKEAPSPENFNSTVGIAHPTQATQASVDVNLVEFC
ncbi:histidine kinase like sensor protein [Calothrix sp. NIES-4071]|nr:histidine kinase like sensor protein [Calothrix sp. NIES-4071]BAZ61080.1 histidine kinase like sensor protein [Calothrix sp. NIES-4105]